MEVGPLSRMLVAYASGQAEVKELVIAVLAKLNAPATALFSTLGASPRARSKTQLLARQVTKWIDQLYQNLPTVSSACTTAKSGTRRPGRSPLRDGDSMKHRGAALGHWVQIEDRTIKNYQCVVPTTWNAGPRDAKGQRGAYEAALLKTPIADPERPVEILRTIHSFDPCLACAVHVTSAQGRRVAEVQVR